jgi:hypothetical protein
VARRYYGEITGRDFLWRKKKLTVGPTVSGGRRGTAYHFGKGRSWAAG